LNNKNELESLGFPKKLKSKAQVKNSIPKRINQAERILSGCDLSFLANIIIAANTL
jgi:hypothetical protein